MAVVLTVALGTQCSDYRTLSTQHVSPVEAALGPMLAATLNASCKPDDVHTVRKLALRYRNLLDVFSPAYPNATASPEDSGRAATSDKKKKHDK